MDMGRKISACLAALLLSICLVAGGPQQGQCVAGTNDENGLVGRWEIYQTKEPGRAYDTRYKGREFVSEGPHSYTVIYQYNPDGTFQENYQDQRQAHRRNRKMDLFRKRNETPARQRPGG